MKRGAMAVVSLTLVLGTAPARGQEISIINLYDAFGHEKENMRQDWGFAALIRYDGRTILFDAGNHADTLHGNARALNIDLREVELAILSHSDADHAAGFDYLPRIGHSPRLYLPEDFSLGAPSEWILPKPPEGLPPEQMYYHGEKRSSLYDPGDRFLGANSEFVGENKEVAPGVFLIATESALTGWFSKYPPHEKKPRFWGLPELSLALMTDEGMVIVVGCSHSKVENIVAKAKRDLKRDVELVMGGFHLLPYGPEEITRVAKTLKEDLGVKRVAPAHCTGNLAFKIFRELYGEDYIFAGLGSEISIGTGAKK
jgi:7,8-dihydropterin-6-yl-methyl-4-(beta-D-ribofuranosyl)aminobenzene 5'-phosphate synthase